MCRCVDVEDFRVTLVIVPLISCIAALGCLGDGCSSQAYIKQKLTKKKHRIKYKLYRLALDTDMIPVGIGLLLMLGLASAALHIGLNVVSLESLSEMGLFNSLVILLFSPRITAATITRTI